MARKELYLNDKEKAFVEAQEGGFVRSLVQRAMAEDGMSKFKETTKWDEANKAAAKLAPNVKTKISPYAKGTGKEVTTIGKKAEREARDNRGSSNLCPKCGSVLMYVGAKCKYCK